MPKRIPTPPPPEDEPRYLVVVHPYPLNANMMVHADRRGLALWLACCTGKDALLAVYHKPSSPGMIIIEVDRYFERFESLLGMHSWAKFLKKPKPEDMDKASKIFYCVYNSGRLVQKNGWKRVDVEEHWFHGWSPDNNVIKHPYPKSERCEVPVEAKTGVPLCRPLPEAKFPKPAPKPPPTVGSAEWINARSNVSSSEAPSSARRSRANRNQAAPSVVSSSMTTGSGPGAPLPPAPGHVSAWVAEQRLHGSRPPPSNASSISTLSPSSAASAASSVGNRTSSNYGAPPPPPTHGAPPPPSTYSTSSPPSAYDPPSPTSTQRAHPPPVRPPGLTGPPSSFGRQTPQFRPYEHFDWSDDVERRFDAGQEDARSTAGMSTVSRGPGGYTAPPPRKPDPQGAIDPDQDYEYDEEDVPRRSTAAAMKDMYDSAPKAPSVRNNTALHDVEEEANDYVAWVYPEAVATAHDRSGEAAVNTVNPWDGYDAPRMEGPIKINIKAGEEWICPEHGAECNPGICKARARLESDRRRQKEHDDRQEAKRKRMENQEKKRLKAESRGLSGDKPLQRYRGAGGRSGSDSDRGSGSGSESETKDDGSQDSGSGSDESSSPPSPRPPPSGSVAGPEDWGEQPEPLWDVEDKTPPRVSLPSGSSWSATGSNGTGNKKKNGNSNIRGTAAASRPQPTWGAPPTASSVSARSSVAPTEWDDDPVPVGAQASAPSVRLGNARGAASVRSAATSVSDAPASAQPPAPWQRQSANTRNAAWTPTSSTRDDVSAGARSPEPGQNQPAWDTRSTTSLATSARTTASSIRNDRSTGPDSEAPVPRSGQQNGRQRNKSRSGASSSTQSENRSTGRPAAINSTSIFAKPRGPASVSGSVTSLPPDAFTPVVRKDGGFPTHADTAWGDPIAAALASSSKSSTGAPSTASRSAVGADTGDGQAGGSGRGDDAEAGQGQQRGAKGGAGRNRGKGGWKARRGGATARPAAPTRASEDQDVAASVAANVAASVAAPAVPDVALPPGDPGAWCADDVEW